MRAIGLLLTIVLAALPALGAKQDVNGSEISWDLTFERERGKFIITYSGRIQEKGMKGKVTYGTLGSGKWTATAQ